MASEEDSHVVRGFEDFYRTSFADVMRVVIAVTGNRHVAAEVAQEAFIAARHRWEQIGGYDKPEFWVRRVAINRSLSWRRRAAREARALVRLGSRSEHHGGDDPVIDEVWRHVRRLPKRQASVIALV